MKYRALLAATAITFSSFVPVLNAPALADTIPTPTATGPNSTTQAAMDAQCDTLAAVHGAAWHGEVDVGSISSELISGPTEVAGTRVIDDSSIVGTGTFTPGTTYIQGDPFRIGGSVNMFGDQYATSGSWSDSTYNYTADFTSTFRYSFNCHMSETVTVPAEGIYVIAGDFGDSEAAVRGNCAAFTAQGDNDPRPDWWGEPFHGGSDANPHCMFQGTAAHEGDEDRPDEAGTPIDEVQTDSLDAFEDHGGPVQANGGPFHIGQVVICISPSTTVKKGVPGAWRQQNGYTGAKCTTDWFKNHAVWGSGTEGSNGTYISVPDYSI